MTRQFFPASFLMAFVMALGFGCSPDSSAAGRTLQASKSKPSSHDPANKKPENFTPPHTRPNGSNVQISHDCGTDHAGDFDYSWCIDRAKGTKNPDVLYAFHGLNGTSETWSKDAFGVEITDALLKIRDLPTVISISFGDAWLVTDLPSPEGHDSLESVIVHDIMPTLEARAKFKNGRREILGISMGGFNAAQLVLKEKNLFSRAVFICPMVQAVDPFARAREIDAELRSNPAVVPDRFHDVIAWMKRAFVDRSTWKRHSVLDLAGTLDADSPPIYLTTGREDQFGFFNGSTRFAEIAQSLGAPVEWHPLDGPHCVYDADSIAAHLQARP